MPSHASPPLLFITIAALMVTATVGCSAPTPPSTTEPSPLNADQFATLTKTDHVAGLATTTRHPATLVETDVNQAVAYYGGVAACRTYWQNAHESLISSWAATSNGDEEILIEANAELWKDNASAVSANQQWQQCLTEFQKKNPAIRHPMKVIKSGIVEDTEWRFSSNEAPANTENELTLRHRNVILTVRLAGDPAPEWRERLAKRFAEDIARAATT